MVRHYKKKTNRPQYDQETLQTALKELKTKSFGQVSRNMKIPKSTLRGWQNNPHISLGSGHPTVISEKEEKLIVCALVFTAKCGFPQGRDEVKDMVQSFIKATKRESPFEDDRPGRDWIILFENRHKDELNKRDPELLTTTRAKGMTKDNVSKFYKMYEDILKEFDLLDKPWALFNIDETGLRADNKSQMVYVGKDVKNAYQLCPPGIKTMYTVLFCISAAGEYLPPYTIYKAKTLWDTWTKGGPKGATYSTSPSGWMFDINFENWFILVFY